MDARQVSAAMTKRVNEEQAVHAGRMRGERRRKARQARQQRQDLAAQETVAERNAALAAACGACTCFGESSCVDCGGEGKPGWQVPDERLFQLYVTPVLERFGVPVDEEPRHALRALSWVDASAQGASL